MKCIKCLSRFSQTLKITFEDNTEDQTMATWSDIEMYGYSVKDKNFGLKTCPFDPNHKIKISKYSQHITKCEQRFPKTDTNIRPDSVLARNAERMASVVEYLRSQNKNNALNDVTQRMNRLKTSDNESNASESPQIPVPSTSGSSKASLSSDSAIEMTANANSSEDNSEVEVQPSPQTSGLTDTTSGQQNGENSGQSERITETRSSESQVISIVPQPVSSESTDEQINGVNDNGSGDSDSEWKSGQNYSLYEGFDNFDDLTDDQIMEMANSFIDVVILNKLSKTQRKELNEKLLKIQKSENELKKKAFSDLVAFKDVFDPQLKDIPQAIRKPRIDVRELFNLNKKQNKRIETVMSTTPISPEAKECPPNPWSPETSLDEQNQSQESSVESGQPSDGCCCTESAPKNSSVIHDVNTVCNNCCDPLALNEDNIKRMTVFCAKCSGIKFGGYFECHSCKLYGYFANSQISQHLTKHFPKTN